MDVAQVGKGSFVDGRGVEDKFVDADNNETLAICGGYG